MYKFIFLHYTYDAPNSVPIIVLLIMLLMIVLFLFPSLALEPPLLSITSGSSWLYVEWNAQSATFRVLYRESGAPDYQVIVPTTSQLSHNISALQPNTLYNIVVEATHTVTQQKVNIPVTEAYTTPHGELQGIFIIQFPLKYNVKTSAAFGLTAWCSGEHIWTYIMHASVTITLDSVTDPYYYTYINACVFHVYNKGFPLVSCPVDYTGHSHLEFVFHICCVSLQHNVVAKSTNS